MVRFDGVDALVATMNDDVARARELLADDRRSSRPASGPHAAPSDVQAAEAWFVAHGLPYFVDDVRARVHAGLRRRRLAGVAVVATLLGAVVGTAVGLARHRLGIGVTVGSQVLLLVLAFYALTTLRAGSIARWAGKRTLGSLGLLFPLVTRALPLLLLFITFLFINTEVWMVAATLDGAVMWLTVLLFSVVAVGVPAGPAARGDGDLRQGPRPGAGGVRLPGHAARGRRERRTPTATRASARSRSTSAACRR